MKRSTYCYRLLVALLLFIGIGAAARAQGTFDLRVVNMVESGPNIDVFLNDMTPATIADLPVENASALVQKLPVGTGSLKLSVAPAGAGLGGALINQNVPVASAVEYSAIVYRVDLTPKVKVLERPKAKLPGANKALLRVVNLSSMPNPLALDFYLDSTGGTPLFSAVAREDASAFADVRGEPKTLYITAPGSKTPLAQVVVPLTVGGRLTLIVTGNSSSTLKVSALSGEVLDAQQLPVLQGIKGGTLPSVRVMDVWRQRNLNGKGIQPLDVFFDDVAAPRIADLRYRNASSKFGPLTQDSLTIRFAPLNEGVGSTIYTQELVLNRDSDYVVILTKSSEGAAAALALSAPNTVPVGLPDSFFTRVAYVDDFHKNVTVKAITNNGADTLTFPTLAFLTASDWESIGRGAFRIEAYMPGETAPFYTTEHPGDFTTTYLTFVVSGDDSSFQIDVLNELLPVRQEFDPTSSVPTVVAGEASYRLHNVPNPAVGETSIRFNLPTAAHVTIALFDALGREVRTVADERMGAGEQSVMVNGIDLAPGAYLYRLRTDDGAQAVGRMVVVR